MGTGPDKSGLLGPFLVAEAIHILGMVHQPITPLTIRNLLVAAKKLSGPDLSDPHLVERIDHIMKRLWKDHTDEPYRPPIPDGELEGPPEPAPAQDSDSDSAPV